LSRETTRQSSPQQSVKEVGDEEFETRHLVSYKESDFQRADNRGFAKQTVQAPSGAAYFAPDEAWFIFYFDATKMPRLWRSRIPAPDLKNVH